MIMRLYEATVTFDFIATRPDILDFLYHRELLRFIVCISQTHSQPYFRLYPAIYVVLYMTQGIYGLFKAQVDCKKHGNKEIHLR